MKGSINIMVVDIFGDDKYFKQNIKNSMIKRKDYHYHCNEVNRDKALSDLIEILDMDKMVLVRCPRLFKGEKEVLFKKRYFAIRLVVQDIYQIRVCYIDKK